MALACAALLIVGCATQATVPALPVWRDSSTALRYFDSGAVTSAIYDYAPKAKVDLSDAQFVAVNHEWAQELTGWAWDAVRTLSARTDNGRLFHGDTFDCDKFAKAFSLAAELSAGRKISDAQVLVGRIYVNQVFAFGGVPAGGAHALNFYVSDRGIYIVEPQTSKSCPLAEYPNRATIYAVKIGG